MSKGISQRLCSFNFFFKLLERRDASGRANRIPHGAINDIVVKEIEIFSQTFYGSGQHPISNWVKPETLDRGNIQPVNLLQMRGQGLDWAAMYICHKRWSSQYLIATNNGVCT